MVKKAKKSKKISGKPGKTSKKKPKLTPRQQKFVRFYMIHRNATKAAKLAGYSENSAQEIGSENLSKPLIREQIEAFEKKEEELLDKEYNLDMAKIRKELTKIGTAKVTDYMNWDETGKVEFNPSRELKNKLGLKGVTFDFKPVRELDVESGEMICTDRISKVKFNLDDRVKSLQLLGVNIGMFKESGQDNGDTGKESLEKRISEIARRIKDRRK